MYFGLDLFWSGPFSLIKAQRHVNPNKIAYHILKRIPHVQESLIDRLFPDVNNLKSFRSPFRNDRHPSASVFQDRGVYIFKDFSTNQVIPIIKLYKQQTGKSYVGLLIDLVFNNSIPKVSIQREAQIKKQCEKENVLIRCVKIPFQKEHIEYLEHYNIDIRLTEMFRMYAISHYAVYNDMAREVKDMAFCYEYDKEKYKLYFPLRKRDRFLSNTSKEDVFHVVRSSDTVVVCTSIKDALALVSNVRGYYDLLVPTSETSVSETLLKKMMYYRNRIVIPDNDDTGMRFLLSLKMYNTDYIIPKKKDIADDMSLKISEQYKQKLCNLI